MYIYVVSFQFSKANTATKNVLKSITATFSDYKIVIKYVG